MVTDKKIRWGIIGCGNVTEVKSGPAFSKVPDSALIAVMRRNAALAKDYAARHQVPKWYADADELVNDPEINAIYVATPPGSHEAYAVAALAAGKNVYVEKPMSVDVASCKRMQQAAAAYSGKLVVAHYRRALPMFLHIKKLIAEKAIGEVRTVRISLMQAPQTDLIAKGESNWRTDPALAGAGLFYDLAPHQLDLLQFFFGNATDVCGISANQAGLYAAEDVVTGCLRLPGNILFTGQWCYTVDQSLREDLFELNGSAGRIRFSVFDQWINIVSASGEETQRITHPQHIQQPLIEKIVRYFSGEGENPCPAEDAIITMGIMEKFAYPQNR